jgi:hypothetical protein
MLGDKKITGTAWAGTAFPAPLPGPAYGATGAVGTAEAARAAGTAEAVGAKGVAALSGAAPLPGLWGVSLDMPLPSSIIEGKKNALPFDKPVLVSALVRNSVAVCPERLPPPQGIAFRAAALASMFFAPLSEGPGNESPEQGLSFAWEMDEPVWLPNPKRRSRG